MKVGHIHTRRNCTRTLCCRGQVINVVYLDRIARRDAQDRGNIASVERESVATVRIGHSMERQRQLMISRTQFRLRKWQALVCPCRDKNRATNEKRACILSKPLGIREGPVEVVTGLVKLELAGLSRQRRFGQKRTYLQLA